MSASTATLTISDNDFATTLISAVQGAGLTAAAGTFAVEAIVTGIYPSLSPAGFYIQEESSDADANASTSEGIFVVSATPVAVGDRVRVLGTVQENASAPSFNQAVFSTATVTVLANNIALPAITDVNLPVSAVSDFERYEGMRVRFPGTLTVTNNFTLGRFGEVGLSAGGVVYQPSQVIDPNDNPPGGTTSAGTSNVAAINALINANALRTILLDDGANTTTVLPYADPVDNTLRLGSTTQNLTGIMGFAFDAYRIQPLPVTPPAFIYAPRPAVPSVGASNLKIASFNVLNYFNGNGLGGGFPTTRGANSLAEFNRQRAKIITAIAQLNADVVGLTEIENDGIGPTSAIQDLVNGLNAALGAGTYSIVNDGATIQSFGTDEIRCGIIYKSSAVNPVGAVMLSPNAIFNRPPVAQTFTLLSTGIKFNFVINHFKSKGCTSSSGADLDQADGQACYNARRKLQSTELLNFFNTTVIPSSGTDRIITVGDYNAYEEEDPLDILRAANYIVLGNAAIYSYQFDGQIGALDHAIVSPSLNAYVTGIDKWNINAAEPVYLDYNDMTDDGGSDIANPFANTYTTAPFRSSDHDPVIIGLNLPVVLPITLTDFTAVKSGSAVGLNWTAAQEKASREFIVERSAGNVSWQSLAIVAASGDSRVAINYSARDEAPAKGINLYRLKSVNKDGSYSYSPVRKVDFDRNSGVRVYPNPASDRLFVEIDAAQTPEARVEILTAVNKVIAAGGIDSKGQAQLDLSALRPGLYFARVISGNGSETVIRFTKK